MKGIYFDNIKNPIWIGVLILSLVLIVTGGFELFENPKLNKTLSVFGFLLQFIYYTKFLWHKNYFQWNKKRAYIKMNSWTGKSLNFDQIETTDFTEKKLTITKKNKKKITVDLREIKESDTWKLYEIFQKNTNIHST